MCINASQYVRRNKQEVCEHAPVHECTLKMWKLTFLATYEKNVEKCAPPPPLDKFLDTRLFPGLVQGLARVNPICFVLNGF